MFKEKTMKIILLLLPLLFITSCIDTTLPEVELGVPIINDINKTIISRGDTLIINGLFFDVVDNNNYISISDSDTTAKIITSINVLQWQTSRIKLLVSDSIQGGLISIYAFDSISNSMNFTIREVDEIKVVTIAAGSFLMGAIDGNFDETPVHNVIFDSTIIVSTTEISQRLYKQVMDENPSFYEGINLPINNVEWIKAIEFCNKLSAIENYQPCYEITDNEVLWIDSAKGWRLPTEAEWEYFAKAGRNSELSYDALDDNVWFNANSGMRPQVVGLKNPNNWGLYDVLGNVYEWCWDYYSADYYQSSPELNPKGASTGNFHIKRGGAFNDGQNKIRFTNRQTTENLRYIGFRIVRNNN